MCLLVNKGALHSKSSANGASAAVPRRWPSCLHARAVKVDENNVQKAKAYTALALEHDPSLIHANFSTKALLDHEVLLMQALDCQLLLFSVHPDVADLLAALKRHPDCGAAAFEHSANLDKQGRPKVSQCAWSVACDVCCSRACLMEAPSSIALACVLLAAEMVQVRPRATRA